MASIPRNPLERHHSDDEEAVIEKDEPVRNAVPFMSKLFGPAKAPSRSPSQGVAASPSSDRSSRQLSHEEWLIARGESVEYAQLIYDLHSFGSRSMSGNRQSKEQAAGTPDTAENVYNPHHSTDRERNTFNLRQTFTGFRNTYSSHASSQGSTGGGGGGGGVGGHMEQGKKEVELIGEGTSLDSTSSMGMSGVANSV